MTLVKPQFEAGRDEVGKHGVVRDDGVRARVLAEVVAAAEALGLVIQGHTPSPIEGLWNSGDNVVGMPYVRDSRPSISIRETVRPGS